MDTKICLAIVTNRNVQAKTVESLLQLKHPVYPVVATEGYTIAENRAYCVYQAMKANCSHILFIDDDMTFPPSLIEMLLKHGKEIVGVNSQSRTFPLRTTVSILKDGKHVPHSELPDHYKMPTELFEVYGIGMGVALIDMNVFDAIEQPWFSFKADESGKVVMGEDQWFCEQAKKAGYKIYCDPTFTVGHIGSWEFSLDNEVGKTNKVIIDDTLIKQV